MYFSLFYTRLLQHLRIEYVHLLLKFDFFHQISNKEVCIMADKEKYLIKIQGKLIEVSEDVYYAYFQMFPL